MFQKLFTIPIYLTVLATGGAGLVYQVTWQKYLSRLLGSDSMATAVILATFLGGLSFGYYLCGKITAREINHFKAYALLEGAIGAWCLFFPISFQMVEAITRYWSFSPPAMIIVQGMLCSILLMGIPTICMGGTIPFLTRGMSSDISSATNIHAKVYAINTAGAFFGALLAGFYLIPEFGLPLTVMYTALVNLGACIFFYVIALNEKSKPYLKRTDSSPVNTGFDPSKTASLGFPPLVLYLIAFSSGFYVMTLENVLIRLTKFSIGSSSYSFSMIVSVFILSIAIGSYAVSRLKHLPRGILFFNQFAITILLLGLYMTLDTWPYYAHVIRLIFQSNIAGFGGYYAGIFVVLTLLLILPVGLMGATVPIIFNELKRELKNVGKHSGYLFSWNTIGNLLGSLIGGIICFYFLNNSGVFLLAAMVAALSACLVGMYLPRRYLVMAGMLTLIVFAFNMFTPLYEENRFKIGTFRNRSPLEFSFKGPEKFFKEWMNSFKLKYYNDGPTTTVAVLEKKGKNDSNDDALSIIVNGKSDSSTSVDASTIKLLAHLPALFSRQLNQALVIGLGTGVTVGELTLYPELKQIDVAEISPSVVEALPLFEKYTHSVHRDPRVSIHIGDAFRVMGRSNKKWDIIISEPSNVWVTGVDLLFTKEFYELATGHLSDGGVFVQWIQLYSTNYAMLGMMVNTVQQEFEFVRGFFARPGDLLLLASKHQVTNDDLARAHRLFETNSRVRDSLKQIHINNIDAILIRETWPPSYGIDFYSDSAIQTLDNPTLHYMAGKTFFLGKDLSVNALINSSNSAYHPEYLFSRKYPGADYFLRNETFDVLIESFENKMAVQIFPMPDSLRIKAYLTDPEKFPLSEKQKMAFKIDLLPFIMEASSVSGDWSTVDLENATYTKKAETLYEHVYKYRNWIVPYPLDGLKALLKEGMNKGKSVSEKNWCTLTLALLLIGEREDKQMITEIFAKLIRNDKGDIIIDKKGEPLLKVVEAGMRKLEKKSSISRKTH